MHAVEKNGKNHRAPSVWWQHPQFSDFLDLTFGETKCCSCRYVCAAPAVCLFVYLILGWIWGARIDLRYTICFAHFSLITTYTVAWCSHTSKQAVSTMGKPGITCTGGKWALICINHMLRGSFTKQFSLLVQTLWSLRYCINSLMSCSWRSLDSHVNTTLLYGFTVWDRWVKHYIPLLQISPTGNSILWEWMNMYMYISGVI